tara:strand:+ start:16353 stop:17291 length:939 start_codon:yes stop_codon:yes gene_type:complete
MATTKVSRGLLNTGISDSSNATAITINSSEQVGIGTTSPVATLQVKTQADANLAFQNSTSVTGGVKLNCFNDAANASSPFEIDGSSLQFNIGSTEKMRINSSGNVGIGTTAPTQKLAVNGGLVSLFAINSPGTAGTYTFNATALDYVNDGARSWSWGSSSARGTFNWYQLQNDGLNQKNTMQLDTSGNLRFDSGCGAPLMVAYGVRAWVRFKGSTSGTGNRQVNGSGNVSSVGYIAAGRYRMNFSDSMPDLYYAVSATAIGVANHNPQSASMDINNTNNVTYVDLAYGPSGGASSVSISNDGGAEYNAIIVR